MAFLVEAVDLFFYGIGCGVPVFHGVQGYDHVDVVKECFNGVVGSCEEVTGFPGEGESEECDSDRVG